MKKLVLLFALAIATAPAYADFVVGNLKFKATSDTTAACTGGTVNREALVIPETVYDEDEDKEYTVTEIADDAFSLWGSDGARIQNSVTLPKTIKKLGARAFYYQSFASINLPEGLESIGEYCFDVNRNLAVVVLPTTLSKLGNNAFNRCGLQQVFVLRTEPAEIGTGVFNDNQYLNIIVRPSGYDTYQNAWTEWKDYITDIFPMFVSGEIPPYDYWGPDGMRTPSANYNTYTCPVAFTTAKVPELTAWTVDSVKAGKVYASKIESNEVPAHEGVILKSDKDTIFVQMTEDQNISLGKKNMLVGVEKNLGIVPSTDSTVNYVLNDSSFTKFDNSDQWRAYVPANHAYLSVPAAEANDSALTVVFAGTTTGIRNIATNGKTAINGNSPYWYTLSGMRTLEPKHGIYIHNGKKVIIK